MRLAKVLGAIGRACITLGTLLLLFVAYQLWGTGIREAQAQSRLGDEFEELLVDASRPTTTTTAPGDPTPVPTIAPAAVGEPTAQIRIPRIGLDKTVVEGVGVSDLKKGPGHYPESPLPGQKGNAAIAGHRTTYGAPFNRVDELKPGDEIFVTTVQGEFRYLVQDTADDDGRIMEEGGDGDGHQIVSPSQVEVLEDKGDDRLTLTACHPKYSARQRIVIVAELGPNQTALAAQVSDTPPAIDDIDGEGAPALPAILLGLLCVAIWFLAWAVGRQWRKWPAYLVCGPFFAVSLFFFFEEFSRLLPSNF
ncbi:MAG: class E sortase [Acidimicrobiales bacterium]|nr:class E sortase [Acidimicrobiales bacterium]